MSYSNPQGLSLDELLGGDPNASPNNRLNNNDSPTAALRAQQQQQQGSASSPSFSPSQTNIARPKSILEDGRNNNNTTNNNDHSNLRMDSGNFASSSNLNNNTNNTSANVNVVHSPRSSNTVVVANTNPGSPNRNPLDQEKIAASGMNKSGNSPTDWMTSPPTANDSNLHNMSSGNFGLNTSNNNNNNNNSQPRFNNNNNNNNNNTMVGGVKNGGQPPLGDVSGSIAPPPDSAEMAAALRELNQHQRHPALVYCFVSVMCFALSIASTATETYSYDRGTATPSTNRATFDLTLWTAKFCVYGYTSTSCIDDTVPFAKWCTALGDRWRAMQAFSILVILYSFVILVLGVSAAFPNYEIVKRYVWSFVVAKTGSPSRFILYVSVGFWFLLLILWALMAGSFHVAPCSDSVVTDQRNRIYGVRTLLESGFKLSSGFALALVMWFYMSGAMMWMYYRNYQFDRSHPSPMVEEFKAKEEMLMIATQQHQRNISNGLKESIPQLQL